MHAKTLYTMAFEISRDDQYTLRPHNTHLSCHYDML